MRHVIWLTLLPGLLFAAGDQPGEADVAGGGAPVQAPTWREAQPTGSPAGPQPLPPATLAFRDAINALHRERQAFIESFDWNQPGDRIAMKRRYGEHMQAFDTRELELRRDWYQATGDTERLARAQAVLDRLTRPHQPLPDLDPTHAGSTTAKDTEVTR